MWSFARINRSIGVSVVLVRNFSLVIFTRPAQTSGQLVVRFVDVSGDADPPIGIDLLALYLGFDPTTGDYQLVWVSDPSDPFVGTFRLNANLYNSDTGSNAQDPAFLSDVFNDFTLSIPQHIVRLSGNSSRLMSWSAGDRVAPSCPSPLGCPDAVASVQTAVGPQSGSAVGVDRIAPQSSDIIVPEPRAAIALAAGIVWLAAFAARRRVSSGRHFGPA
jgi:hypothetical protein